MPLLRLDEVIATAAADDLTGGNGQIVFGLGGDDAVQTQAGSESLFVMGGAGGDAYRAGDAATTVVLETGGSGGDVIVATGIGVLRQTSFAATIDNRHFYAFDQASGQKLIVLDWQRPESRIETVQLAEGSFALDLIGPQLSLSPRFLGNLSWSQTDLGVAFSTAEIDEAIEFYRHREQQLSTGQPGGGLAGATEGADLRIGTAAADVVPGLGGSDTIFGLEGSDALDGGSGDDVLIGDVPGLGDDTILGGDGADTGFGGDGRDVMDGGSGDDLLVGDAGEDLAIGGAGNDVLFGGGGADAISGEGDSDFLFGDAGADSLRGGDGNDRLHVDADDVLGDGGGGIFDVLVVVGGGPSSIDLAGEADQNAAGFGPVLTGFEAVDASVAAAPVAVVGSVLPGGFGNVLFGSPFADTIIGSAAADLILGNPGADSIQAAAGEDTLIADAGNDTLAGGDGPDRFFYPGGPLAGTVRISDFVPADDILLLGAGLGLTPAQALAAFVQIGPDLVLDLGAGQSVILAGVSLNALSAADLAVV